MYLGLPLRAPHRSVGLWDSVEERFRKRLVSWKKQYISKDGRLKLIYSTLSSLSIYFLSLFRMPKSMCSRLEKIQRDFLWGGGNLERKPHLVNWKTVCSEKKRGGLGLRSLSKLNQALLCKWSWRFANEMDPLWRTVISTKFGELDGGWNSGDIRGSYDTGLWKDIKKEWSTVSQNVVSSLGDGRRLNFWKDSWCGEATLCTIPSLFNLAAHKDAKVANVCDISRMEGGWSLVFLRSFNDKEVERFLHYLHKRKVKPLIENQLLMKHSKSNGFSVRLMYSLLTISPPILMKHSKSNGFSVRLKYSLLTLSPPILFPSRFIWNPIVPPKLGFFA